MAIRSRYAGSASKKYFTAQFEYYMAAYNYNTVKINFYTRQIFLLIGVFYGHPKIIV